MARGRPASRPDGSLAFTLIVGCTAFALGVMNPPPGDLTRAGPVKTLVRAMPDGTDLGFDLKAGAWVGLNDPSLEQAAFFGGRSFKPAPILRRLNTGDQRIAEVVGSPRPY